MTIDTTRLYRVLDAQSAHIVEESPAQPKVKLDEALIPYPRNRRGRITVNPEEVAISESVADLATYNFPDALRQGLMFDAFSTYNETPVTYNQWARVVQSDKQQEEYLRDSAIGLVPQVAEGQPYPKAATSFEGGVTIVNGKRGMKLEVTREMMMFDQVGKVRDLNEMLARSLRRTEEQDAMNVLTTTANYTRTNTAGDNDESATGSGANQQTLTFSAVGLIAAFNILRTMKDRKTKIYLNVVPDTLVVAPKLWWFVQQLIGSPDAWRVGGNTTNEIYGNGGKNSFFNVVNTIIVSPEFGNNYEWALMERQRGVYFQRVLPLELLTESATQATTRWMDYDTIAYRVGSFYGVGMKDDRYNFFSNSTTAPTVS